MQFDFVIIGSGFGGSVSALRLAEKGYQVAIIEQGKWVDPVQMEAAAQDTKKLFWIPGLGLSGFFRQSVFRHLGIVGGVGVGGGSLVYAAVLLKPKDKFYEDPLWGSLGIDWKEEMSPFYEKASKMLGITPNPVLDTMDHYLKMTARVMGAEDSFGPTPMGIFFGTPEVMEKDPFFNGKGPERTGCHLCGECLTGCPHGAKNSLDKNYLYLAQKSGAIILDQRKVVNIAPMENGGYEISMKHPIHPFKTYPSLRASKVILSSGVLGTLELLYRCRDVTKTLPKISRQMGKIVRTNSEAIVGSLSPDPDLDLSKGTTISSDFYPDAHTHITQN
ncbi:MAG: FAD-binding protein, partial [Proteobacteria bacterium]|nr:FAD-binding protein [Pseudomonadota bacterium]